ncbi:MAG: GNAT family N-acetyltransferase [Defluviitaleaceae bacterium]|nr:GNAT family N-acetyltransferase [Defluviitaleaceae bacterium]
MEIRKTILKDLDTVMEIYAYARDYMKKTGNPNQWRDNHPPQSVIEADIRAGCSYVCINGEKIVAVFYYNLEEEPTYREIMGKWLNNEAYGVVHRIARTRGPGAIGAGAYALKWCIEQHSNVRIDTHKDNAPMLKLLENLGFTNCGIIWLANGDQRVAFHYSQ